MAKILCLETATTNCSVAISENDTLAAVREYNDKGYSHAEKLHVFIQEVLEELGLTADQLDAVAVSKGPGSYTGLRIGVSAAKGICFAADLPLISVPTLDALARQVEVAEGGHVIPLLDARRMEVYSKILDHNYQEVRTTAAQVIDDHSFSDYLDRSDTIIIGSGAQKVLDTFPNAQAKFETDRLPSSKEMIKIAWEKFQAEDFESVAYFEPYYLKDFIAG